MRDIRGDLQDRANQVAEQISATQEQFDKVLEQLKLEHKAKLEELKSDLGAIRIVIKTEDRLGSVITPTKQSEPQAQSQRPTSDSLMRRVSALR